ncbi:protein of unknown function [Streptomyces murinus]
MTCAPPVHFFVPVSRQPPGTRSARVRTLARSEPASCSLMPMEKKQRPAAIAGRNRCFCSSVPWARIEGPAWRSATQCAETGAPAASNSSITTTRAANPRPPPPYRGGSAMPTQPRPASRRLKSGSQPVSQESGRPSTVPRARSSARKSRTSPRSFRVSVVSVMELLLLEQGGVETGLAEHLVGVLAEGGAGAHGRYGVGGVAHRAGDGAVAALGGMLGLGQQAALAGVGGGDGRLQTVHGCGRDADAVAELLPFGAGMSGRHLVQHGVHLVGVAGPQRAVGEPRVGGEFRAAGEDAEVPPVAVAVGQDAHPAVRRALCPPGAAERPRRAELALHDRPGQMLDQVEGEHGVGHRHLDVLTAAAVLPVQQGGEYGLADLQSADLVGDQAGHEPRFTARPLVQPHQPGDGLDDVVVRGAGAERGVRAEALRVDVDQAGVDGPQLLVPEPEPVQGLRTDVGEEHVRGTDQGQQRVAAVRRLEVDAHTALVAVEVESGAAHPRVTGGWVVAGHVSARGLDLDDVGAEVTELLGGVRDHDHAAQLDDADPGKHSFHCVPFIRCDAFKGIPHHKACPIPAARAADSEPDIAAGQAGCIGDRISLSAAIGIGRNSIPAAVMEIRTRPLRKDECHDRERDRAHDRVRRTAGPLPPARRHR